MPDLFRDITICSVSIIFLIGIILSTIKITNVHYDKRDRLSRRFMICAYFLLTILQLTDLLSRSNTADVWRMTFTLTLAGACIQACLFTFSIIILIGSENITVKMVCKHLSTILIMSGLLIAISFFCNDVVFTIMSIVALSIYVLLILLYLSYFHREYRGHIARLDNYFSDDEAIRLRWLRHSFYTAFFIGGLTILSLYKEGANYQYFVIVYSVFYTVFGIKYINYLNMSKKIEPDTEDSQIHDAELKISPQTYKQIASSVEKWKERKGYKLESITLKSLANELGTNQTYLSKYINCETGVSFKIWIANLRVEEAKKLILLHPEKSLNEIGEMVGISNKSSFFRQFVKMTGVTPGTFRNGK